MVRYSRLMPDSVACMNAVYLSLYLSSFKKIFSDSLTIYLFRNHKGSRRYVWYYRNQFLSLKAFPLRAFLYAFYLSILLPTHLITRMRSTLFPLNLHPSIIKRFISQLNWLQYATNEPVYTSRFQVEFANVKCVMALCMQVCVPRPMPAYSLYLRASILVYFSPYKLNPNDCGMFISASLNSGQADHSLEKK